MMLSNRCAPHLPSPNSNAGAETEAIENGRVGTQSRRLLDDEVMVQLLRSAGFSAAAFRTLLLETAERLADEHAPENSRNE